MAQFNHLQEEQTEDAKLEKSYQANGLEVLGKSLATSHEFSPQMVV